MYNSETFKTDAANNALMDYLTGKGNARSASEVFSKVTNEAISSGELTTQEIATLKEAVGQTQAYVDAMALVGDNGIQGGGTSRREGRNIVGTNYSEIKPTQDNINPEKVAEYIARLRDGEEVPPVKVIEIPGKGMYIINGHHRYVASQQAGIPVKIIVMQGQGPTGMPDWSNVHWKEYISESQFWED